MIVATTTTQLLEGLRDLGAAETWREFDERYRPVIVGMARRIGLGEEDAADVAQETLTRFVQAYRQDKYDRGKGRLRSWIIGIARHLIADRFQSLTDRRQVRGQSAAEEVPEESQLTQLWEAERRTAIMARAMDELRATSKSTAQTVRAFELVAIERRAADEVAEMLGMTRHDVYVAKHRVTQRLREIVASLEAVYDAEA